MIFSIEIVFIVVVIEIKTDADPVYAHLRGRYEQRIYGVSDSGGPAHTKCG